MKLLSPLTVALVATTSAQALATLAVFALPVLATKASADLGAAAHWLGLHVAIVYLHAAAVSAFGTGVLRRFGPARTTQVALAGTAVGLALPAWGGLWGAGFGAALLGLSYGFTNPAASDVLNRLAPPGRRNLVFALKQTGVPLGGILGGLALPSLAIAFGWQAALLVFAAATLGLAAALQPLHRGWDAGRDRGARLLSGVGRTMAILRENAAVRTLATVGTFYSAVQLSFTAYLVAMLVEGFGWTPVAAGAASAAAQACGAVGRLGWAALADRLRDGMRVVAIIGMGTAVGLAAVALGSGWPAVPVVLALCWIGACALGWNGVLLAEAARLAPAGRAGEGVGAVLAPTFLGGLAGPPVFGVAVALSGGYALPMAGAAVVIVAGVALARRR